MAIVESTITPEDLLKIRDRPMPELVDGQLVERPPMGMRSDAIASRLGRWIGNHVDSHDLGFVCGAQGSYQVFPDDPRKVRIPDVSFLKKERMPAGPLPEGHCRIVPDLVVEVISPNDQASDLNAKIEDFLNAGVPLIWIADPRTCTIQIFRADGSVERLRTGDSLDGENVLPGFRCEVARIFEGLA